MKVPFLLLTENSFTCRQIQLLMKESLLVLILLAVTTAYPPEDEVYPFIPGYTSYRWYSGMLDFDDNSFHYVLFDSQRDPNNDPLVLWYQGGPGCSSLIGMTTQNGPFTFKTGTANFRINPYAWNKEANLLYIQTPAGTGFSYNKNNDTTHDDGSATEDNYRSLVVFFAKFPNLLKNDFYLTGQSYAGITIPYLADYILTKNSLPQSVIKINLKGILVGNPCTDPKECYEPGNGVSMSIYQYENLYIHGWYTEHFWDQIHSACSRNYFSQQCSEIRQKADRIFYQTNTSQFNLYAPCLYQKTPQSQGDSLMSSFNGRMVPTMEDGTICEDRYGVSHWLNDYMVQKNLHVPYIHVLPCNRDLVKNYTMFPNASYWLYPKLVKSGIRVWVFEGDVDNSVPITGTYKWVKRLREEAELPIQQPWREWWVPGFHKHEDQVGGMVWKLKGFTLVTVKNAGHFVPADKPKESKVMLDCFLKGQDLPTNPNIEQTT